MNQGRERRAKNCLKTLVVECFQNQAVPEFYRQVQLNPDTKNMNTADVTAHQVPHLPKQYGRIVQFHHPTLETYLDPG